MGKRQIRIYRKDILQRLPELKVQQAVQVILRNRVVLPGRLLVSKEEDELALLDARYNIHQVPLQEIEEVIYDIEAPY